uniref:DUF3700 domain-containing protein n=1 Tax=Rhizophora mucronata TaxID=61149 RepID=A0A2P2QU85_RHIMU
MLAVFSQELVNPPQELSSPATLSSPRKPKLPEEILEDFVSLSPSDPFSIKFGNDALLAYNRPQSPHPVNQRLFCGFNDIYCIFLGSLDNLCSLNRQYGLSKGANEAMFVIEAYRTLRDRGPYPAHQVLNDLDGRFGFVIYDAKAGHVFAALGANEVGGLHWGIAANGSVVISDKLEIIKGGCSKSYAPFPSGCMFHSEQGLMSFEHPRNKVKAMPRIDSEGTMCGANFKADVHSKISTMPRVGSEANWALRGPQA